MCVLDPYGQRINDAVIHIYDAFMRLESQMLALTVKDLTIVELHILEAIGRAGDGGCSVSDLAQVRQVSLPSMTVSVKRLERKGLVEKTRNPQDGRRVQVRLTRAGSRYHHMHMYFHQRMVRALLRDIPQEERPALLAAVNSLEAFLDTQLRELDQPQ